jgi:hypothetical protein
MNQLKSTDSDIQTMDDEVTLKDIILTVKVWWKYFVSKWVILFLAGVLGGAVGLLYAYFQKPVYTAYLSFALEEDQSSGGLGGALGLASQFGFNLGGSGGGVFEGDNLLQFMISRSMVEKALLTDVEIKGKRQTLADYYIEFNELRDSWEGKVGLEDLHFISGTDRSKFNIKQDSVLGEIHKSLISGALTVDKIDKKLSLIEVKVKSVDEFFAKSFTEILTKEVADFYTETKTKKSAVNVAILQKQTDSVRIELNAAILGVASTIDNNPNPNMSRQALRVPSQRRQVDVQANTAILQELIKNLEMAKVALRNETPLIQIIDRPIIPLKKDRVSKRNSLLTGGFLSGFIVLAYLIFKRLMGNGLT